MTRKYTEVFRHPSGDVCVCTCSGQLMWLRCGKFIRNKDGSISRKILDKRAAK